MLQLKAEQLQRLGISAYSRSSPFFETCCLRVCANESYQHAQDDLKLLLEMYNLKAKAIDNWGAVTFSSPVSVIVRR